MKLPSRRARWAVRIADWRSSFVGHPRLVWRQRVSAACVRQGGHFRFGAGACVLCDDGMQR